MSESKSSASSGGIGFVGLLTIVFITLKLLGKIEWSWLWVLSPMWISIGLGVLVLGGIGVVALGGYAVVGLIEKRDRKKMLGARRTSGRIVTPSTEDPRRNTYLN